MGIKFTMAEDAKVIQLKEQSARDLSWKDIRAAFASTFPGTTRKFNDLQVRYTRSLKPGTKFRAPALLFLANAPAGPAPPPPPAAAAQIAAPPAQLAQAGGQAASTRRPNRASSAAATRHQSKVTTRKTRSAPAPPAVQAPPPPPPAPVVQTRRKRNTPAPPVTTRRTRSTPLPPPPPPAPVSSNSTATAVADDDDAEPAEVIDITQAAPENPPASPTVSDFDPPTLAQIQAFRDGDASITVYPRRALSEISDFDPPTASDITARRSGTGGPITDIYPAGGFASAKDGEEDVVDLTADGTAGSRVATGRVTKPQAVRKGKGKAKAKGKAEGRQPAKAKTPEGPQPKKDLEDRLYQARSMGYRLEDERADWGDDWADIAKVSARPAQ